MTALQTATRRRQSVSRHTMAQMRDANHSIFSRSRRPAVVKRIISFLMWICSRRKLQHQNPTAMGTGARRDGSDREFGLESIVALAAAIHSVKPRGRLAKREYPEALLATPRRCNSLSISCYVLLQSADTFKHTFKHCVFKALCSMAMQHEPKSTLPQLKLVYRVVCAFHTCC